MKTTTSVLVLALTLIAATGVALADIARPNPTTSPGPAEVKYVGDVSLEVVPDSKGNRARLQISQETLTEIRDAIGEGSTGAANRSFTDRIAGSSTNTIIAGLFMFLSVSFAGVWLARSAKARHQKAVAAILIGFVMLSAAAIITNANQGPPASYFWRSLPKNLNAGKPTSGQVDIEIVPDGYGMKLIVPIKDAPKPGDD